MFDDIYLNKEMREFWDYLEDKCKFKMDISLIAKMQDDIPRHRSGTGLCLF